MPVRRYSVSVWRERDYKHQEKAASRRGREDRQLLSTDQYAKPLLWLRDVLFLALF